MGSRFFGALAAMVIGETIIFTLGVGWLKVAIDVPVATALDYGLWPFLLGDALKVVLAAAVLPFGWWVVNRRPSDRCAAPDGGLEPRRAAHGTRVAHRLYHEFLRVPTMSAGYYRLPAGGTDPQRRTSRTRSMSSSRAAPG